MEKKLWTNKYLILLHLIKKEFDIDEATLFSDSAYQKPVEVLAIMADILNTQYGVSAVTIYEMFTAKGYNKGRTNIYNYLKLAKRILAKDIEALGKYKFIVYDLEGDKLNEEELRRKNESLRLKGRVYEKISKLSDDELSELESSINVLINTKKANKVWLN